MHSLSSFLAEEFDIMKLVFHGTPFGEKLIEFLKRKALKNIGLKLDLVPPSCPLGILGGHILAPFCIAIHPHGSQGDWLRSLGLFKNP